MDTAILEDESGAEESATADSLEGSGVHPVQRLKSGDVIAGKYVVRGTLGAGGFAVVYEAEHPGLGRRVAIKVMHVEPEMPLQLLERFRLEARISAVVRHPNVLEVYDTGTLEDGSPYLVMELIEGETLYRRMARQGLSIPVLVEVATQLLTALEVIADRGIVHRDIKPENIMLHQTESGSQLVKVLDFGISKHITGGDLRLTRNGALIGTPHYMSPEQIRGDAVDLRSDLYAVGVVLYEALTGRVPYDGPTLNALVLAALNSEVPSIRDLRPDCPRELERIVLKAMSRAREARYQSPTQMKQELITLAQRLHMPRGAAVWQPHDWCTPPELRLERKSLEACDTLLAVPAPPAAFAGPNHMQRFRMASLAALLALGAVEPHSALPSAPSLSAFAGGLLDASASAKATEARDATQPKASGLQPPLEHIEVTQLVPTAATTAIPRLVPEPELESLAPRERPSVVPSPPARGLGRGNATPTAGESLVSSPSERGRGRGNAAPARLTASAPDRASTKSSRREPASAAVAPQRLFSSAAGRLERSEVPSTSAASVEHSAAQESASTARAKRHARGSTGRAIVRDAMAAYVLGNMERAHTLYRRAVREAPGTPEAWRGLGVVAARRGHYAEARRAFGRYLDLSPDAKDAGAIRARSKALP